MELHRPYLLRGKEVTNVCAIFLVTGLKEDLNTKLKMTHTAKCDRVAHLDMEMRAKLRGIFNNHIYPIAMHEFGWLCEPVVTWLDKQDVTLFLGLLVVRPPTGCSGQGCTRTQIYGIQCLFVLIMMKGSRVVGTSVLVLSHMSFSVLTVTFWFTIQLIIMEQPTSHLFLMMKTQGVYFLHFT
jgi:hypothetical protein